MSIPVVILAGGLATRLRPLSTNVPKSLIPIYEKPFIFYQLELLSKNKINKVHVCLGYLGEMVEEVINESVFAKKMKITFSYDGTKSLGTGGAIKNALNYLDDIFFVIYGDSYLNIDFIDVLDFFNKNSNIDEGLMTVYKNNSQYDTSNVVFADNKIIKYSKTDLSNKMNYIDYGLGIFRKSFFDNYDSIKQFDLSEIYEYLSKKSKLIAYESSSRFYEIGSFDGLKDFKNLINKNYDL